MGGMARVWAIGLGLLMTQLSPLCAQSAWPVTPMRSEHMYPPWPPPEAYWAGPHTPPSWPPPVNSLPEPPPSGGLYRGHEQALEAVRRGEAKPLRQILRDIHPQYPGRILRVQFSFDPHFHVWVYELRILQEDKLLLRLKVDALTAEVLRVRGRHKSKKGH